MQFDEFKKAIIQVVECHFEVIFCFLTNRNFHFFQVDKMTIQVAEWQLSHFLRIDKPKIRLW